MKQRQRFVLPEFFKNAHLASMPARVRLFLIGLYTHADRAGRMIENIPQFRGNLFPHEADVTDGVVEMMLDELSKPDPHDGRPPIIRYKVNGVKYIEVVNFSRIQSFHGKEKGSDLPAPDRLNHTSTMLDLGKLSEVEGKSKGKSKSEKREAAEQFVDLYHRLCPSLARCRKITAFRMGQIVRLLKDLDDMGMTAEEFLERVEASDWLTGRHPDCRWESATIDFIIGPKNCVAIAEGKHDNRKGRRTASHSKTSGKDDL